MNLPLDTLDIEKKEVRGLHKSVSVQPTSLIKPALILSARMAPVDHLCAVGLETLVSQCEEEQEMSLVMLWVELCPL